MEPLRIAPRYLFWILLSRPPADGLQTRAVREIHDSVLSRGGGRAVYHAVVSRLVVRFLNLRSIEILLFGAQQPEQRVDGR